MTRLEQAEFVVSLTTSITEDIIRKIKQQKIPEEWDGIELRRYISWRFKNEEIGDFTGKRKRDYNNEILIRNL